MQIPYLQVRGRKALHFMRDSIGPRMEICGTSGLPIPMVPCFNQSNYTMKRKLRAWRVQNCITLLSVEIPYLPVRGRKVPHFMGGSIGPRMDLCGNSGLPIPMVPRSHQSNGSIKRKVRAWRVQKCITLSLHIPYLPVRGRKVSGFMGGSKNPVW